MRKVFTIVILFRQYGLFYALAKGTVITVIIITMISNFITMIIVIIMIIMIRCMSSSMLGPRRLHQRRVRLQTGLEGKRMQYQVRNDNHNPDDEDDDDDKDDEVDNDDYDEDL